VKLKELVDQMNGQKDMEEKERRALGERVHDTVSVIRNDSSLLFLLSLDSFALRITLALSPTDFHYLSLLKHIIRKNAVRLMLSYRAANVRDREKWVAILDEGFVFTLPITPYRCASAGMREQNKSG
jgi:hypothetical protein